MIRNVQNSSGFGMIAILISITVLGIAMAIAIPNWTAQTQIYARVNHRLTASMIRGNIYAHLDNPVAWNYVTTDATCNPSLACLKGHVTGCTPIQTGPIRCLYDSAGEIVIDLRLPEARFNSAGRKCSDPAAAGCDFRPEIYWQCNDVANCNSTSTLEIHATLEYTGQDKVPLNLSHYDLQVVK